MSSKQIIKPSQIHSKYNYISHRYPIKQNTINQIKSFSIEQLRNFIKSRGRLSHASSLTSMSTTHLSKKQIDFPFATPKHETQIPPLHKNSPDKLNLNLKLKEPNFQIQKQMRKVKMKIRKMILNHQKQKPCEYFEKMNYEYNGKIQDSFTCEQRIKAIKKYNSKFHFGNINYNYIKEPLKQLIDVSEFNRGNMGAHEVFGNLTPQEKAIVALEPSYFVDGQILLMKKVKAKSLSQKLNEEEEEMINKLKEHKHNKNKLNGKYHQKCTSTYSDIGKKFFEFGNQNESETQLVSPKTNKGQYLKEVKSKMLRELNEKMREYDVSNKKKERERYLNDFAKTMRYDCVSYPLIQVYLNKRNEENNNNNNYSSQKRKVISGNDLRLRNTKEFLLKSNSERLINENKRREKQYDLELQKSMNSNMKNYLDNIRNNISTKRQNS